MSNFLQSPASLPRDVLSVTSLNRMAKSLLEGHFPNVLVEGEISNLALPASGHWYFTLKDEGSQVRCAMFRNRNMGAGFRPRDGMQVLVRGRLSLYEGRGDYQLIAESVEEAGDGALRRRFEMLKQKLAAEGLFASERKRPLPDHVRHVEVITSATGAVIRDIISVLQRRFPAIRITLLPVAVQGAEPGTKLTETTIMLVVLGLIDVVMISNLLIMVIVGGYETFASRMRLENHPDQPEWLSHVNASVLKVKLATAIIGISSIHLLKTFINANSYEAKTLLAQTGIHLVFLVSALAIAYADRIMTATMRDAANIH